MGINLLFVLVADLLDLLFQSVFSVDPSKLSVTVIFHFGLIGLVLVLRKIDKIDSLILAFVFGGLTGIRITHDFFTMGFILFLILLFIHKWSVQGNDNLIEIVIILIIAIFLRESMLYVYMIINKKTMLTFTNWLIRRCIPTLIGNLIPIGIMLVLDDCKNTYIQKKEIIRKREESLFFKSAEAKIKKPIDH